MAEFDNIIITEEEKTLIKAKSPGKLPLNPTSQGFSGQQIRAYLNDGAFGDSNSILAKLAEKLLAIRNHFDEIRTDVTTNDDKISDLESGLIAAEQALLSLANGTTIVEKALRDSEGNIIKSTYANKLDLAYSSSNNRIAITLKSYDGTSLDADLINLPKATDTNDGLMAKEDKAYVDGLPSALLLKENKSEKGVANGYASLDSGAKIHSSQLPDSILGQLEYKGTFNPSSGYPVSPEKGWFYIAIANALISGVDYKVGDWAVYNGGSWDKVDNTDAVASVNGKLGAVILYGTEIQVGNGDTWTVEQRIVNIYAELNNRYTKAQTYSNTEIEQRLTDLLGMANLQDILIGSYTNGQTVLASDLSAYNFVIVLGKDVDNTYTGTFKPSEIVSGNIVSLSSTVYLTRGATSFTITTPTSIKMWGIKLDGIDASEIAYDGKTVEDALNEIFVPTYVIATHEALQTEITATNAFEINDETGDVIKITGNEPDNLVVNGDFSDGITSWEGLSGTISVFDNELEYTTTNLSNSSRIQQQIFPTNLTDTYYFSGYVKPLYNKDTFFNFGGRTSNIFNPTPNTWNFISSMNDSNLIDLAAPFRLYHITDTKYVVGDKVYFKNIVVFNVSTMKLKGVKNDNGIPFANLTNGEIKSQLDIWVENGFPTVVEKLISKSDNLFNAEFNTLSSLDSENLVVNGDFIDTGEWTPYNSTLTANNNILTMNITGLASNARIQQDSLLPTNVNDTYYFSVEILPKYSILSYFNFGGSSITGFSPTPNQWNFHSQINSNNLSNTTDPFRFYHSTNRQYEIGDEVKFRNINVYNITDLVSRGILPSGLTKNEYKEIIDNAMFANVPLRETNYIAVET